jgi:hypothetical protein
MDWIKPIGRTQTDIDAARQIEAVETEKAEARAYLQATDHEILKAVEKYLLSIKAIDTTLISNRAAAREKLLEAKL